MNAAKIAAVDYYLPQKQLSNEALCEEFPDWSVEKISAKTGITSRRIAANNECSSDLAVAAAEKLFSQGLDRSKVDFLVFCTQSPDYFLPTTACLLQDRLGIPTSAGALDFNLGCSGYVSGLGLAKGLIESGQASGVLFLTGETYSKFLDPEDRSVRTVFGDGASATFLTGEESEASIIGPFIYGTDGSGAKNLIVQGGAFRDSDGSADPHLRMNGSEIFSFTLKSIPSLVQQTLAKAELTTDDVDWFVFHQANKFMLEHLRDKIGIPEEKFAICLDECGNTVSSSIPIALKELAVAGQLKPGQKIMLVGFGVGYSWGATIVHWKELS